MARKPSPTVAVIIQDGKEAVFHVPAGAEIVVLDSLHANEGNRQVNVEWTGKRLKMFAADVWERGERI